MRLIKFRNVTVLIKSVPEMHKVNGTLPVVCLKLLLFLKVIRKITLYSLTALIKIRICQT